MKQQTIFCQRLSVWLFESDWHFTTLLASCINNVDNLPGDVDGVINQLLLAYPAKPRRQAIEFSLIENPTVRSWFRFSGIRPKVIGLSLNVSNPPSLFHADLPALPTLDDLAEWLEISFAELNWLADLWRHNENTPGHLRHYHYSLAPKRDGSFRLIESPKALLKKVQRQIAHNIIACMPVHTDVHGFVKGRNCQSHATRHTGQRYLIQFDLSNYFQSIRWSPVFRLFNALGYTASISRHLTGICSHRCYTVGDKTFSQLDSDLREKLNQRHLPQGAASSPSLSNAVLYSLDRRLSGLARSMKLNYSRYADDFVFSGNQRRDWQTFSALVGAICIEQGFVLNYRKTRLTQSNQRQKVTGIVVNEKLNIDRRYYDRLKAILSNCCRDGLQSQNRAGHDNFEQHLRGCIEYVKSLNKIKGDKLGLMFERIK